MNEKIIVVSFTTIPSRFSTIQATLNSIWAQTIKPDVVCLGISAFSKREKCKYKVPLFYQNLMNASPSTEKDFVKTDTTASESSIKTVIQLLDQDYGPVCKLLGGIEYIKQNLVGAAKSSAGTKGAGGTKGSSGANKKIYLFTIDDDMIYHPTFIQDTIESSLRFPDGVIALSGFNGTWTQNRFSFKFHNMLDLFTNYKKQKENCPMHMLLGFTGVLYPFDLCFSEDAIQKRRAQGHNVPLSLLYKWTENPKLRPTDDATISGWLDLNNIPRFICKSKSYEWNYQTLPRMSNALSANVLGSGGQHIKSFFILRREYGAFRKSKTKRHKQVLQELNKI